MTTDRPPLPGSCWPDGWVIPTTLLGPWAPAAHGDLPFEPHLIEMKANRETLPPGYDTWKVEDSIDPSTRLSPRAPLSQKKKTQIPNPWVLPPLVLASSSQVGFPGPRSSQNCASDLQNHEGERVREEASWWSRKEVSTPVPVATEPLCV